MPHQKGPYTKNQVRFYAINMARDTERLHRFSESFKAQNLSFERHEGPLITAKKVTLFGRNFKTRMPGNVGVAMAHLTLWQKIAHHGESDVLFNVMEDDEHIREHYLERLLEHLGQLDREFDFFNLNVLRPRGREAVGGILQIQKEPLTRKLPNIWLSNYLITAAGAQKLLALFESERRFNINTDFDRTLVRLLHRNAETVRSFVLKEQHKLSFHYEKESSKKDLNSSNVMAFYYRLRSELKKLVRWVTAAKR